MSVRDESELGRMQRLCSELRLPEVVESTSYGAPSLKVKAKNFASVRGPQEMVLHCPLEQKELLMEMAPEIYWQTDHFKNWPGLLVRLEVIGDEELKLRLEDAWRFRAPKRLADDYAKQGDGGRRRSCYGVRSLGGTRPLISDAVVTVLASRQAMVIGPTPPGTGVIAPATLGGAVELHVTDDAGSCPRRAPAPAGG